MQSGGNGRTRSLLARVTALAVLVPTSLIGQAFVGSSPVALAETVFDTGDPDDSPRIAQQRDLTSVNPARLLETRTGPGLETIDGQFSGIGPRPGGDTVELTVAGRGGVPDDAQAVLLNVTAVVPEAAGFLTVFPCGTDRPLASNVNYGPGDVVPNAVLAKVGAGGKVCIYTLAPSHLVVDVNGFVGAGSGVASIEPARILETRSGPGDETIDGKFEAIGRIGAGETQAFDVAGRGGVASDASTVMLNVTAVNPEAAGFVTLYPCGSDRPLTSNVNYGPGDVVPNAVLVKVGDGGQVCAFSLAETDLVVDVNGFVAGDDSATSVLPARLLETRSGPLDETIDGAFEGGGVVPAGGTVELQVAGRGGVPDAGVGAVLLNVTAITPAAAGFLTVFPCGSERPNASNVNYDPGDVVPNAVLARIGNSGKVCIYTLAASHIVVDVGGWFELAPNQPNSNVTVLDESEFTFTSVSGASVAPLIEAADPLVPEPEVAVIETDTSELAVGDIVVVEKPTGEPYYGRVEQREEGSVRTEQVALAEVVPAMDVSLEADTGTGEVVKNEGGDAVSDVKIDADTPAAGENQTKKGCEVGGDLSVDVSGSANPGRFVFDVSFSLKDGLESAEIGYSPIVEASASVTAEAALSCSISRTLFTKKLPSIKFLVGTVPVLITQKIDVSVSGSVTAYGSVTRGISASAEMFVGVVYEDGHWDRKTSVELNFDQIRESETGIDFAIAVPALTYEARAYGIIGFDIEAAATLRLTFRENALKYNELTATVSAGASAVIELDLLVVTARFSFTFVNVPLYGPKEIWSQVRAATDCDDYTTVPSSQCEGLVSIYDQNDGSNWNFVEPTDDWGSDSDPCGWTGVTCAGGNVTGLNLAGQGLTGDLATGIGDLPGLQALNLRNNSLGSLPHEIGDLGALRELTLASAGVESIPYSISGLANLTDLDLSGNSLTSMPSSIDELTSLEYLNLSSNSIGTLPRSIGLLSSLTYLDVRFNGLTALPVTLWQLTALGALDVSGNDIATMPSAVGQLRNLQVLDWSVNELTSVPPEIGNLTNLEILKLASNPLGGRAPAIATMSKLQRLYLGDTGLTELPSSLSRFTNLTHLELGQNDWDSDGTVIMRAVRDNNAILSLSIGPTGCLRITDATVAAWIDGYDARWDNGC